MFTKLTATSFALSVLASAASAASMTLYDDMTLAANPDGVWSHGYYDTPGDGSTFTLFDRVVTFVALPNPRETGGNSWSSSSVDGYIGYNANVFDYDVGQLFLPSMGVFMGPRSDGGETVVRWTAPVSGSYDFDGAFTDLQNVGLRDAPDGFSISTVGLSVNGGSPVLSGDLAVQFETLGIDQTFALDAGDTVDFWVNRGPDIFQSDTVGLELTVTSVSTPGPAVIPLPASGVLLFGGLAALGLHRQRRDRGR